MSDNRKPSDISSVHYLSKLPSPKKISSILSNPNDFQRAIVICDKKLKPRSFLQTWTKDPAFCFYFVTGSEKTKSIETLSIHLKKIVRLGADFGRNHLVLISLGGGSLGDLTGFIASIYKRGIPVIHVPTTPLAALDSSHGGKTALNFSGIKNIIGTLHFPIAVFIVEEVFHALPLKQNQTAYGELLKIALIEGGRFYENLKTQTNYFKHPNWRLFLKQAISAKIKIVRQDPFEKKNIRRQLNFGHTIGHILEAGCAIPHGQAVLEGMLFSIKWSVKKKLLSKNHYHDLQNLILKGVPKKNRISLSLFKKLLQQDKKHTAFKQIDFIFIKNPGSVIIKTMTKEAIVKEAQRQGLIGKIG